MELNMKESVEVIHLIHEQQYAEIGTDIVDIYLVQLCAGRFEAKHLHSRLQLRFELLALHRWCL